ncbi:hypothetical protein IPA_02700 [Ignicoccus pacificus DSM 13166]|uniref:ABC transmembrane type-2 domain-containing protein n=1 Tax=Ignicoccus pacificus DSM 13166 TaxID=940294 RepID=A0A977KAS0_9CREN|nr:hypothetical protein IPA_02700 [Ignicoccus pacificus DSM 13166]
MRCMKARRIRAFVKYSLWTFARDKSDVFWVIVWPIMLLFITANVFLPSTSGKPVTVRVGVLSHDPNGTLIIKAMEKAKYNGTKLFKVIRYNSMEKLVNDLKKAKIGAGIVIPKGFYRNLTSGTARLTVYVSGGSSLSVQLHEESVRSFLYYFSKEIAKRKLEYVIKYIGSNEFVMKFMKGLIEPLNVTMKRMTPTTLAQRASILGWLVWGAIGMSFLYTGLIIGATAVVIEKEKKTLDRILTSPVSEGELLLGKLLGGLTILGISAVAVVLSGLAMGARVLWNPFNPYDWIALVSLVLVGISTISMGFLLSLVSKTAKGASNLGVMLGLLFTFTAGIWIPKEMLPSYFKTLAEVFPPTWGIDIIRGVLVLGRGAEELVPFVKLLLASTVLFALGVFAYRRNLRRYVEL